MCVLLDDSFVTATYCHGSLPSVTSNHFSTSRRLMPASPVPVKVMKAMYVQVAADGFITVHVAYVISECVRFQCRDLVSYCLSNLTAFDFLKLSRTWSSSSRVLADIISLICSKENNHWSIVISSLGCEASYCILIELHSSSLSTNVSLILFWLVNKPSSGSSSSLRMAFCVAVWYSYSTHSMLERKTVP